MRCCQSSDDIDDGTDFDAADVVDAADNVVDDDIVVHGEGSVYEGQDTAPILYPNFKRFSGIW